jgi:Leucine-rich repeat (LRR) protein
MRFIRNILLCLLATSFFMTGCVKENVAVEQSYGYVQFKLYKEASYVKAVTEQLEYLSDVTKIRVTLKYEDNLISQTLLMNAFNEETAEFGLRSDKLKLLAGSYELLSFSLYDKMDNVMYESTASDYSSFDVVPGGLNVHDLTANVVPRGKVRFTIVKDLSSFDDLPAVKAAAREYTFDEISYVTLDVRSEDGVKTTFTNLPVKFSLHFKENGDDKDGYMTSTLSCDSLLTLRAGRYDIESYITYDESKSILETNSRLSAGFTVEDNVTTDAEVPVALSESDEYIKDYYALREIWRALGGQPDENGVGGWYYVGEDYPAGCNWDFNKDPDLWGDQPGVSLHANGRVALINISGFGFAGHMPAAIGQLTELVELYLGTHNDSNLITYKSEGEGTADRMARHKAYLSALHPATPMAEPIAKALSENGIVIPETAFYSTMKEDEVIDRSTGRSRIKPMDMNHGTTTNGLLSLPPEIGNLTKLEQLFIANGEITSLPAEMAKLISCTDLELYNCPKMTEFPMALAKMPELITANLANNRQWSSDEVLKGLKAIATGPSAEKIQLLYLLENNLEVIPKEIKNMKKLGLLDFASNKIHTIEEAWGNEIKPVQLYLDNNKITEFPVNEDGVFCYLDDAETFSARNNKLTEFPDIFDANSLYSINSIDFSYNEIKGFPADFKGVKVNTLTLANNPALTKYPVELAKSNSTVAYVNVRGCNIDEIPEGSFEYENSIYLTSLDLSYNDLTDLPWEMHAGNLPYLYGVELSFNKFSQFPWEPLDSQYLTVFSIRSQRNDAGERCLSEWPTGLYNHRGLRGFYIGSNNLGKIEDTISTLIYYLDISDNPEIIFDASDICYAYQTGAYVLIYDKTQDIRNCPIMMN